MAIKTFTTGEVLTAADTNTYLANSGLVFVKSQTVGSGVSSTTLTSVFSSTYDTYKIIYSGGTLSANSDMQLRLGPTSVSGYNTSYDTGLTYGNPGTFAYAYSPAGVSFSWIGGGNSTTCQAGCELIGPNLAQYTRMNQGNYANGANFGNAFGIHYQTNQYTDITLIVGGGYTFSGGTFTVYGYRKG